MVKLMGDWSKDERERIARMIEERVMRVFDEEDAERVLREYYLATINKAGMFRVMVEFARRDEDWMRLWWTENKYMLEVFGIDLSKAYGVDARWSVDDVFVQKAVKMLEKKRFEEEYVGELKKLGLQLPDEVEFVLSVDKERELAVVENSGRERYLCSKYGYWKVGVWMSVRFAVLTLFKKDLYEVSKEELDSLLMEKAMEEAFGGDK